MRLSRNPISYPACDSKQEAIGAVCDWCRIRCGVTEVQIAYRYGSTVGNTRQFDGLIGEPSNCMMVVKEGSGMECVGVATHTFRSPPFTRLRIHSTCIATVPTILIKLRAAKPAKGICND